MFKVLFNAIYSFKYTSFKVKLLHQDAKVPKKADDGCAGYDILSETERGYGKFNLK